MADILMLAFVAHNKTVYINAYIIHYGLCLQTITHTSIQVHESIFDCFLYLPHSPFVDNYYFSKTCLLNQVRNVYVNNEHV